MAGLGSKFPAISHLMQPACIKNYSTHRQYFYRSFDAIFELQPVRSRAILKLCFRGMERNASGFMRTRQKMWQFF